MVETGKMRQGFRGSSPRVWPFLLEKGGIMVWSPDIYLCGCSNLIYCVIVAVWSRPRIKVPKDRGVAYSSSSYLVTEVTRPCVGRDPVRFSGRPSRSVPIDSRKFLSLTICWKSIFQYEPCTVLVVEPAIYLWWSPLDGRYSMHSSKCICWLRLILYFRNVFHTRH